MEQITLTSPRPASRWTVWRALSCLERDHDLAVNTLINLVLSFGLCSLLLAILNHSFDSKWHLTPFNFVIMCSCFLVVFIVNLFKKRNIHESEWYIDPHGTVSLVQPRTMRMWKRYGRLFAIFCYFHIKLNGRKYIVVFNENTMRVESVQEFVDMLLRHQLARNNIERERALAPYIDTTRSSQTEPRSETVSKPFKLTMVARHGSVQIHIWL